MLCITIHEDGEVCRLELAGKLEGPWVAETEKAWRASLRLDQMIEIDLRQLTSVDNAGRDLLAAFSQSGACLIVEGACMTTLQVNRSNLDYRRRRVVVGCKARFGSIV